MNGGLCSTANLDIMLLNTLHFTAWSDNLLVTSASRCFMLQTQGFPMPGHGLPTAMVTAFPTWSAVTMSEVYPDKSPMVTRASVNIHMSQCCTRLPWWRTWISLHQSIRCFICILCEVCEASPGIQRKLRRFPGVHSHINTIQNLVNKVRTGLFRQETKTSLINSRKKVDNIGSRLEHLPRKSLKCLAQNCKNQYKITVTDITKQQLFTHFSHDSEATLNFCYWYLQPVWTFKN
jgi:hypothetical protein